MEHVFVRHPPLPAMRGICHGHPDEAPSNAVLGEAAEALAARLPVLPIASSPSARCLRLASKLHARLAATGCFAGEVIVDPRLREMHFGDWEGRRWDEVPRDALDAWSRDLAGFAPAGGESFDAFTRRVSAASDVLHGPHIVVTNAGVIRAAHCSVGMSIANAAALVVPHLQPLVVPTRHGHAGTAA